MLLATVAPNRAGNVRGSNRTDSLKYFLARPVHLGGCGITVFTLYARHAGRHVSLGVGSVCWGLWLVAAMGTLLFPTGKMDSQCRAMASPTSNSRTENKNRSSISNQKGICPIKRDIDLLEVARLTGGNNIPALFLTASLQEMCADKPSCLWRFQACFPECFIILRFDVREMTLSDLAILR